MIAVTLTLTGLSYMPAVSDSFVIKAEASADILPDSGAYTAITEEVAKSVHEMLQTGYGMQFRMKAKSLEDAKSMVSELRTMVKKVNKAGVNFYYDSVSEVDGYYVMTVSANQELTYTYACKVSKKIYNQARKQVLKTNAGKMYVDRISAISEERFAQELVYGYILYPYLKAQKKGNYTMTGYTELLECIDDTYDKKESEYFFTTEAEWTSLLKQMKIYLLGSASTIKLVDNEREVPTLYQFISDCWPSEFPVSDYLETFETPEAGDRSILRASSMSDLSSMAKVWCVARSGYFGGSAAGDVSFKMKYVTNYRVKKSGYEALKAMAKGDAKGNCEVFTAYEQLLFKQYGITSIINKNANIAHMWLVVKVKNYQDDLRFVPFDYGIGPIDYSLTQTDAKLGLSESLRSRYLGTEAKAYKLYLKDISGSSGKMNFESDDFR